MLKIQNLSVNTAEKEILKSINMEIKDSEIVCVMGRNGAGKSSLCKALMHHPAYTITEGSIIYNGKDMTHSLTSDLAKSGIYYINQNPVEIEGITNIEMLKTALVDKGEKVDIFEFNKKCNDILKRLDLPRSFLHRNINQGMSGGERKKNELFGMWILKPSLVILDEIDSGLDVDALQVVGQNLKEYHEETGCSILMITHQQKLIDILNPDKVIVLNQGEVASLGDKTLAKQIEEQGFSDVTGTNEDSNGSTYE